jgi:hypothetical protein
LFFALFAGRFVLVCTRSTNGDGLTGLETGYGHRLENR